MNEYPNNTYEAVLGPFKCFLGGSGLRPEKCGAKRQGAAEREREAPSGGEEINAVFSPPCVTRSIIYLTIYINILLYIYYI